MGVVGYLLDTHTFLWALRESPKLSNTAKELIENESSLKFVSAISAYEIMYKHKIGKLQGFEDVAENYIEMMKKFGAIELPITAQQAYFAGNFEWEHRDPFDRILAAQASTENLVLITNDDALKTLTWIKQEW